MTFGDDWGFGASRDESKRQFDAFAERGGNFIESAVNYTNGSSETIVGELIASDRAHFVVATKYSLNTRPDDPNAGGNQRKNMVQSIETSLKRLGTDYIDLYWVHFYDPFTPIEETMRALDDLVRAGSADHVFDLDLPSEPFEVRRVSGAEPHDTMRLHGRHDIAIMDLLAVYGVLPD
jgi:aryl-alcohol dehydrogenase-like predicted oxidoreductase